MTDWKALCEELADTLERAQRALRFEGGCSDTTDNKRRALIARARAALAAEPTITRQPEFPGQVVWQQGSTLGIAPDEATARADAARAVEPVAAQRTDVAPLQVALARVERLADDFSSACRPLVELAEKLTGEPVVERSPLISLSALLHPAYEPGDGSADGAQMVEMAWWHPVMGCDSLQIVVDNARAALAEPVGEGLTDEELLDLDQLRDAWNAQADAMNSWDELGVDEIICWAQRQVLARYGHQPAPPAEGEVAELALKELERTVVLLMPVTGHKKIERFDAIRAALKRLQELENKADLSPAPAPAEGEVAELVALLRYEAREADLDLMTAEQCHRAADLLERQAAPVPVAVNERLPGPKDCDAEERCWLLAPRWILPPSELTHWLPATALPLPSGGGAAMSGYGITFGALCDDIEVQLQRQGFTLGDRAPLFQRWSTEINSLRIHGLLTESESDRARKRLWKELTATAKPLPCGEVEP